jgi:RNA polymerase primary sigma factor
MEQAYEAWRKNQTPENLNAVLDKAAPTIDSALYSYAKGDKTLRSRARLLAAGAIRSFDPSRDVKLKTHLMSQLQPLSRAWRERSTPVKVPERVSADLYSLNRTMAAFKDNHGREPSTQELADHAGLSMKRIAHVRKYQMGPIAESALTEEEDGEKAVYHPGVSREDPRKIWAEYVYHDLDPVNQKILEWKNGLHGQPVLSVNDIAKRLGVTAGAVSQRSAAIAQKLALGQGVEV